VAGRRRYAVSAVKDVGLIVLFREIGFSLAEQQHRIEVARTALEHGRRCPASEHTRCPRFWSIIEARQRGL